MGNFNLGTNERVKIYYNDLLIGDKEHIIYPNCPFLELPWRQSVEYAEKKISSKEWSAYIIPALSGTKVTFGEEEYQPHEENLLKCPCGNNEEIEGGPEELTKFYHSGGSHFICAECHKEIDYQV